MPAFPTNSLIFFPCACWSEGCFFGHWRSDVTFPLIAGGATRRAVRKHRAPKGALRLLETPTSPLIVQRQKAPSAKRCIKTPAGILDCDRRQRVRKHRAPKGALRQQRPRCSRDSCSGQKAPSAKRCIKTWSVDADGLVSVVRKHRAPKGALRQDSDGDVRRGLDGVRKHRAPKGALRLDCSGLPCTNIPGQKAPSAKRYIKTSRSSRMRGLRPCQKAPSAKRCIKTTLPWSYRSWR